MQPQKTQRKSVPNHLVVCSVRTRPDRSAIYIHIYRHGTSETTSRTLPVRRKPASHPAKPNQKSAWGTPSKKPNSSKIRCKPSGKTEPKRCLGSAFEEAEQQQDSRPCHAKPQPQKRKIRAQALRNRNQKKTLETLPTERIRKNEPPGKTQPKRCLGSAFEKAEQQQDSPQATQQNQTKQVPEERLRKSRAAARFAPMHCETATKKKLSKRCLRNALERKNHQAKPNQKGAWGAPSKKPNSSKIRRKPPSKTKPNRCLRSAFEKAHQQQDSRPCTAKPQPKKLSKRCLRNALERKNHQAKPNQKGAWGAPSKKPNSSKIRRKPPGKTEPKRRLGSAFEKAHQQQDSCPSAAKPQPKKRSKRCLRNALKRNSHQAKPNQKSPSKKPNSNNRETLPTERIKKKQPDKTQPKRVLRNSRTAASFAASHPAKPIQKGTWGAPSNKQNSSKIRGQALRNRNQKNSQNVAYGTH